MKPSGSGKPSSRLPWPKICAGAGIARWAAVGTWMRQRYCRRIRRAAREGAAIEARSGTILLLTALIPLCDAASARGPSPPSPVQRIRRQYHTIVGFQHRHDAERFLIDLKERLAQFALTLHPDKTRLIEFGRYAAERRAERGNGKPETFDFLGFTHYCTTKKDAADFQLGRRTQRKRMKAKLREIKEMLRRYRHAPIDEQGKWLGTVIKGYFAYFAVPTNTYPLSAFRYHISLRWERMRRLITRFLPSPRVLHPWPDQRFGVTYSR